MNFKNLKIGTKLFMGFFSLILAMIIVGFIGYNGMQTINGYQKEVSEVRLPSIQALLTISEAQTAVDAGENALLSQSATQEIRNQSYKRFDDAKKRADDAWKVYEPLPQSDEEARVWKDFVPAWEDWWKFHEEYVTLSKKYEEKRDSASYEAMSYFALTTISEPFSKAESLINRIVEINAEIAVASNKEADKGATQAIFILVVILLIGLLFAILIGVVITRSITRPLNLGVNFANEIAGGNLTATIDVDQKDEIGKLANALKEMVLKLREVVGGVLNATENIASASQQMSANSEQVSEGASEQASSVEEVSSSMEQMASNIQQNTDNARQTEKIAAKAAEDINEGSKNVNMTVESMKMIAGKVSIIGDIAFQTNILALNAAVEAARAGEHGKGFAVVAAEVRKLAERSQIAAGEIDALSKSSVDIAEKSGKLLQAIVPDIQKTSKLVEEITAASIEQNSGADQINNAIGQLNQVTQQNSAASEEMATGAEELSNQAEELREMMSFFRIDSGNQRTGFSRKEVARKVQSTLHHPVAKTAMKSTSKKNKGVDLKLHKEKFSDDEFEKF